MIDSERQKIKDEVYKNLNKARQCVDLELFKENFEILQNILSPDNVHEVTSLKYNYNCTLMRRGSWVLSSMDSYIDVLNVFKPIIDCDDKLNKLNLMNLPLEYESKYNEVVVAVNDFSNGGYEKFEKIVEEAFEDIVLPIDENADEEIIFKKLKFIQALIRLASDYKIRVQDHVGLQDKWKDVIQKN